MLNLFKQPEKDDSGALNSAWTSFQLVIPVASIRPWTGHGSQGLLALDEGETVGSADEQASMHQADYDEKLDTPFAIVNLQEEPERTYTIKIYYKDRDSSDCVTVNPKQSDIIKAVQGQFIQQLHQHDYSALVPACNDFNLYIPRLGSISKDRRRPVQQTRSVEDVGREGMGSMLSIRKSSCSTEEDGRFPVQIYYDSMDPKKKTSVQLKRTDKVTEITRAFLAGLNPVDPNAVATLADCALHLAKQAQNIWTQNGPRLNENSTVEDTGIMRSFAATGPNLYSRFRKRKLHGYLHRQSRRSISTCTTTTMTLTRERSPI